MTAKTSFPTLFTVLAALAPSGHAGGGAPGNDDCANATPIGLGTTQGTNAGATLDAPTSCDGIGVHGPGVFYSFTAPLAGTLVVSTCGTNDFPNINGGIDTVVTVFDACGGNELACNDDEFTECGDLSFVGDALVTLAVQAQDTLIIEVSSSGSTPTGSFFLNVAYESAPFADGCSGDGGDQMGCSDCPCGNNASPGTIGGCLNSAGTSGRLLASGSTSVLLGDLRFEASGIAPQVSCVLISGDALAPQNAQNPCFGLNSGVQSTALDGLRCVIAGGGTVLRHGVRPADANGDVGVTTNGWGDPNGFFQFNAFSAGETKHFQVVHRDTGACGTGQNTTQAVSLTFTS